MLKKAFACTLFLMVLNGGMAREYLSLAGTSSHINGPNCWNSALYGAGVVKNLRFIGPKEWLFLLDNNCEEVKNPQRGDIGRLFSDTAEIHGFIHLDDEMIFAKHGMAVKDGYRVMSYQEMMNQYGKSRACRMSGSNEPECFHHLRYYRCYKEQEMGPLFHRFNEYMEELLFSSETDRHYRETCREGSFITRENILSRISDLIPKMEVEEIGDYASPLKESYVTQLYEVEVSNRYYKCKERGVKKKTISKIRKEVKAIFDKIYR